MLFVCHPKIWVSIVFSFSWELKLPRETEINAYAKFWGDKQRALWYVMIFFWSGQYGGHIFSFSCKFTPFRQVYCLIYTLKLCDVTHDVR